MTPSPHLDAIAHLDDLEAAGVRNVPSSLDLFDQHFPRFPVLPGVLILASLADLAALVLHRRTGVAWRLAGVRTLRYRHYVRPGDQVELRVKLIAAGVNTASLSGVVQVDGRTVTTARSLALVPA